MPGEDVVPPAAQRAGHAPQFGHSAVGEVLGELVQPAGSDRGVVAHGVQVAEAFLRDPGVVDLTARVPRGEQAPQVALGVGVEAFRGEGQQLAGPVERVALTAAVPEGVVLHPASDRVHGASADGDDMEGPAEAMNLLIKKVKRVGHGFRKFANYRLRVLLYTGGCNWDLLGR